MRVVKFDFSWYICTKGITCIADHILFCIWTVFSARVLYANKKRNKKLWFHFLLLFVGVAGFEPTTPCSQSRCANRTALHPETFFWASCRIRTNDPEITNHVLWPTELKRREGSLLYRAATTCYLCCGQALEDSQGAGRIGLPISFLRVQRYGFFLNLQ